MYRFLFIALLGACLSLTGCKELQNPADFETDSENASREVTARFCHIARIGSLAAMSDDVWDSQKENTQGGSIEMSILEPQRVTDFQEAPIATAVGQEVSDDFMAIIQSVAKESATDEGIRATNRDEQELDLAIEMVEEEQLEDAEIAAEVAKEARQKASGAKSAKIAEDVEDEEDVEDIDVEDAEEIEVEEATDIVNGMEIIEDDDESDAKSDAESDAESDDEEETPSRAQAEERQATEKLEKELERQAEAYLEVLKNIPEAVLKEIESAGFQNLSYRMVKVPGSLILGKTAPEYYIIRTMEYVGTNRSKDYQILLISRNFSTWMREQEKYLDILTLDEDHHEFWVEAPEFWNSSKK